MPYKSDAQRRYFNANREELEAQGVDVDEWNESSKGKKLPEKVKEAFSLGSIRSFANSFDNPIGYLKQQGENTYRNFINPTGEPWGPNSPKNQERQRRMQRFMLAGTNGIGQQATQPNNMSGMYSQMNQIARQPNMMGTGPASNYQPAQTTSDMNQLMHTTNQQMSYNPYGTGMQLNRQNPYSMGSPQQMQQAENMSRQMDKQFNPYGTGMGFNGGLGGGLNGSSVGGNYGQAAGTNAAAVPGASQMKLGEDQQDTRPSAFSVIPGIGGFISGAVKENPGVKSRFGSSLGEGVTGLAGGLLGGTLLGKLLGHAAYGRFMSKIPASQRSGLATDLIAENMVKNPAQGYGGLMGGIFGTNAGSRFFRGMTQPSEKQSAEKVAFAALKNLFQRFAKPAVTAKSVGENIPEAVGEVTRYLKPRYPLPTAKNLLPEFLDDINSSIQKPRLGVPTQPSYKAQDLASLGHDYSKLDSRPRSLSGDNLPILGKLLKKRYPLPEAKNLMPGYLDDLNSSIRPRFGVPTQRPYKAEDFASIGHDYSKLTSPGGENLPIIGKMAADQPESSAALDTKPSALAYVPGVGGFLSGLAKKTPGVGTTSGTLGEGVSGMLGSTVGTPLGAIGGSLLGMLLPALFKAGRRPFAHTADGVGPMHIGALLGTGIGGTAGSSLGTHAGSGVFRDLFAKPEKSAIDKLAKIVAARCWEGYEPVPGKKPYSDGSCQPKGSKSKAKEKKAFAPLEREYNAMQSGLTGADLGMRIVPGALAGGVVGGVKGLMEDPGYDDRTGKKRSRLLNILKSSLGGAVGGGVVGHLMGAPAMQFGVRKGYELGDGVSRYLSDARDKVEKLSADKRASLGKLLAGGGIGGALGTLLGRYTGYNAGYNKGSSIGEHESLLNLLRGMHGVMRQGAESNLDLKELVNKKASSGCGCGSGAACQCGGDDQNNRASKCSECGEVNCQCQKSASDIALLGKIAATQEKVAFRLLPGRGHHD